MGLFGSEGFTQQRRKLPFSLRLSLFLVLGLELGGDVSSWSAKVPLGAITGIGGF